MEEWPMLNIGGLEIKVPIVQGGMGVGVSGQNLASAVANEGGVGLIASVGLGPLKGYPGDYEKANADALRKEIGDARGKSNGKGLIGVNIMYALTDYENQVRVIVEEGVPLLFTGAGFDAGLPDKIKDSDTRAVLIISYAKFIPHIIEAWKGYLPAAIVIEGPKAGGHLGYGMKRLEKKEFIEGSLEKEVKRAVEAVKDFDIPIIAAGGIYTGGDIYNIMQLGARGVQMGTRFVVTEECDASEAFKMEYINAKKEDIVLIDSPVGLPGRAVDNAFLKKVREGGVDKFSCDYQCLKSCKPKTSSYCIGNALVEANQGDFTRGFAFAGSNAYRCNEIVPVKTLMDELSEGYFAARDVAGKR